VEQVGIHYRSSREEHHEALEQEKAGPVVNVDPVSATVHVSHGVRSKTPFRKVDASSPAKARKSMPNLDDATTEAIQKMGDPVADSGDIPPYNPSMRPRSRSLSVSGPATRRGSQTGAGVGPSKQRANARRMSAAVTAAEQLSSGMGSPEQVSEAIARSHSLSAGSDVADLDMTPSGEIATPDNASCVSEATDAFEDDLDIEEDDDADNDIGDSDVEFDPEVYSMLLSKKYEYEYGEEYDGDSKAGGEEDEEFPPGVHDTSLFRKDADATTSGTHTGEDVADPSAVSVEFTQLQKKEDSDLSTRTGDGDGDGDGDGITGEEGRAVRELFNDDRDLAMLSRAAEKEMLSTRRLTFGPGAAMVHPWTSRADMGINSRLQNECRGDEIYYVGIIDILQQYNASKRAETFFKVSLRMGHTSCTYLILIWQCNRA
jgi:hypothetical protein